MAVFQVVIVLSDGKLIIKADKAPQLLKGVHKIFFSNILGFDISYNFIGYITAKSNLQKILAESVNYIKDKKIDIKLNSDAEAMLIDLENTTSKFNESKKKGILLKEKKVNKISINGLKRDLKDYQIPAVVHMVEVENTANFSVPGSGKTSIVLSAYAVLKSIKEINKLIVIGPRSSFMPWEEEFYACFHKKPNISRIVGSKTFRKTIYKNLGSRELVLLTYQMASNDIKELIKVLQKDKVMLVLDESHNIKRLEGGVWSDAVLKLGYYAKRRVILTGTPTPNSILDLWSQITFLWPNSSILGTKNRFKYNLEKNEKEAIEEIKDRLYPFYWRIRKSDLQLPKPRFHHIKIHMRRYQKLIYNAIATKILSELVKKPEERANLRIWRKAKMVRLLQAASNPSLLTKYSEVFKIPPLDGTGLSVQQLIEKYPNFETPPKIEAAANLVKELVKKKQKVIVWTSFIHNIKTLQKILFDLSPDLIYGDIPKDKSENEELNREKIIHQFKTSSKHMVLIANPSACAESVSLHKVCHHAIYVDRTFNGAHFLQSLDRIHRIGLGKKDKVNYWILECKETIDEVIDERLEEKKRKMLELLGEEFAVLNLESPGDVFSEESEEEKDFEIFVNHLKSIAKGTHQ